MRLLLPISIGNTAISVTNGLTSTTTEQPIVLGYVGAETPDLAIAEPSPDLMSGDVYTFSGTGYGHNLGMSQWGANAMAQAGKTYEEILKFYFTGIEVY